MLDVIVNHAREWADTAAERVVALGLPIDARTQTVGSKATTPSMTAGFQQSDDVIAEVIAAIDATLVTVRTAVGELGGLEKDRWFLFAHLATK